jgi:hypothetical protein
MVEKGSNPTYSQSKVINCPVQKMEIKVSKNAPVQTMVIKASKNVLPWQPRTKI